MVRLFLTYALPLLLPMAMYLLWNAYARAKAKMDGGEPPSLQKGPIFWSLVAGFFLLVATFITLAMTGGSSPDSGQYIAPYVKDGKVVPPHFEKAPTQ